ncbi:MAG: CDP-glycerol glycerophosphotransferase family protein [Clostridia bacterium]|nr:CDP-glycerol glycerophosphotransferase family protein [Clostridia bacterium]
MKLLETPVYKSNILLRFFSYLFGVKNNRVTMLAFRDTVSGNTKAMYEFIKERYPEYQVKWAFQDEKKVPETIEKANDYFVLSDLSGLAFLASSKFIFTDTSFPGNLHKNKNQICFQMWHGDRGFKKVQYEAFPDKIFYDEKYCDYAVCGSHYAERKFLSAFKMKENQMLQFGCPRNDLLFEFSGRSSTVRSFYGIPADSVLVLYAPTLREKNRNTSVKVPFDYKRILAALEKRYNKPVYFLARAHKANLGIEKEDYQYYIDASGYPDMADILLECQVLITDYSSSAGDFILTDKQVILFIPEKDDYTKNDRSLVFEIKESPFLVARNEEDIVNFVGLSDEEIKSNNKAIQNFYGCYETGKARQKIVDFMKTL